MGRFLPLLAGLVSSTWGLPWAPACAQATAPAGTNTTAVTNAGPVSAAADSLWTRSTLGGSWFGVQPVLKAHGVDFAVELTQFASGLVAGDGAKDWEYGGKVDLWLRVDGPAIGLWRGFSIGARAQENYGHSPDEAGLTLVPINASLAIPGPGDGDLGVSLTQKFSDTVTLTAGKMNMMDSAKATPLKGGGGIDTFMNTALAVPVTGLMPPEILGGLLSIRSQPVSYVLAVYDSLSAAHRSIFDEPFSEGVSFRASATLAAKPWGRSGFYGLKAMCSTRRGFDLRFIPDLLLPAVEGTLPTTGATPFYVGVSVQQYISQDATNPQRGWGFFGEIGMSDGNPTPQRWAAYGGVGGTGPFAGREADRWGLAVFCNSLSSHVVGALWPLLELRDEQGFEAYYNFSLTPWMYLTPDVQVISPFIQGEPHAVFASFRLNLKF